MEAKRKKLDNDGSPSSNISSASSESANFEAIEVNRDGLRSDDDQIRLKAVQDLKRQITNKDSVRLVMESGSRIFPLVVEILLKRSVDLDKPGSIFPPELKDVISIIANCCYYSTLACLEMKQPHIRLNAIAVKIAESPSASTECKYSLIRLLANMSAHKEAALHIATNPNLVEQICKFLVTENRQSVVQALRCIQKLISSSFLRVVLAANGAYYLGKLLTIKTGKITDEAIAILLTMCKRYAHEVGRQIAGSDCAETLLNYFFAGKEIVQKLVVRLCSSSSDIRDKFGEKGAIQKIAEDATYHTASGCSFLSTFAQDAWGRASLRTSGALDVLVERFSSDCQNPEKMALVQSFKHFIHDTAGIAHLANSKDFVNTVVRDVQRFVEENASPCKPSIRADDDLFRADSPLLMEIESNIRRRSAEKEHPEQLHKDFFAHAMSNSPSPGRSIGSSANLSPPSSGAGSPVYSSNLGSIATTSVERSGSPWDADSSGLSDVGRVQRAIVDGELWLISWQTQIDTNLPNLIRVDLVAAILDYIALAPRPDFRFARALRRIAGYRIGMNKLLDMDFHIRVMNKLFDAPCRLNRNARRCVRCEKCAGFGKDILREFSQHVDSDFGHSFITKRIDNPDSKTQGAIAKVMLTDRNRSKFERGHSNAHKVAINILIDSLKELLLREDFEQIATESTYSGGPPLCAQIIAAFSSLVPLGKIREMLDVDACFVPSEMVECKVSTEDPNPEEVENYLRFEEDGRLLAFVKLNDACKSSGYFQAMFTADMVEKTSKQRVFQFNQMAEHCSSEDFTKFLHWLAGCRDECTRVKSAESCLALIQLSDRYLCPSLGQWICSPSGPTSRLVAGDSLHYLLPAALTVQMHPRFLSACFATLLRYSNPKEIMETIEEVRSSPAIVETFLVKLKDFVK